MEASRVYHAFLADEADVAVLALHLRIGNGVVRVAFHHFLTLDLHLHRVRLQLSAFLLRTRTGLVEASERILRALRFVVVALPAHGTDAVPELALALLAVDDGHLVGLAVGEAEQGGALVAGEHGRLQAAEAVVHLAGLEVLDDCEGLALRAVVAREEALALLAADAHGVLGLGQHVAEEERLAVAEAADEDALGTRDGGWLAAEVALACLRHCIIK